MRAWAYCVRQSFLFSAGLNWRNAHERRGEFRSRCSDNRTEVGWNPAAKTIVTPGGRAGRLSG
jgi:hypothetical protein